MFVCFTFLDVVEDEFKLSFKDGLFFSVESCCVVEVLGVSSAAPNINVAPTSIEAVPTVNF